MSYSSKIQHSQQVAKVNYEFLSKLTGDEAVGVDKDGRLYRLETDSSLLAIYKSADKKIIRQITVEYTVDKLKELEFRQQETGRDAYLGLIDKFAKANLLTEQQRNAIAMQWYNQRFRDLVNSGIRESFAEAIVVMEMYADPNIDDNYKKTICPEPTSGGSSDSYFIKNREGKIIGVFKPKYQEFGMPFNSRGYRRDYDPSQLKSVQRHGHYQGTYWIKEAAAYEIDREGYVGVPVTAKINLVFPKIWGEQELIEQVGSFQEFVDDAVDVFDLHEDTIQTIADEEVQKMAMFDLLCINGDRHEGNFLYKDGKIIPIDHGLILLENFEIRAYWKNWKQVQVPLHQNVKDWILEYDIEDKCKRLREIGVSKEAINSHRVMYLFLRKGINQGLTIKQMVKLVQTLKDEETSYIQILMGRAVAELMTANKEVTDENVIAHIEAIFEKEDLPT